MAHWKKSPEHKSHRKFYVKPKCKEYRCHTNDICVSLSWNLARFQRKRTGLLPKSQSETEEILCKTRVQGVQMCHEPHLCFSPKNSCTPFQGNGIASRVAMFFSKVRTSCVPLQRSQGTILQIHFGGIEDWLHYVNKRIIVTWNNLVQGVQMWHKYIRVFLWKNSLHPFSGERHCVQSCNVFPKVMTSGVPKIAVV